jgi:hypothetical protein
MEECPPSWVERCPPPSCETEAGSNHHRHPPPRILASGTRACLSSPAQTSSPGQAGNKLHTVHAKSKPTS